MAGRFESEANVSEELLLWVAVTLRYDGAWRPMLTTLANSEKHCSKKFRAVTSYCDKRIEVGIAKICQCRLTLPDKGIGEAGPDNCAKAEEVMKDE